MKQMLTPFIVSTICLSAVADNTSQQNAPTDARPTAIERAFGSFAGTWEIVSVEPTGSTKDAKRLVFRKDGTYAALNAINKELWAGTFDLDPTKTPKVFDHRSYQSQKTGGDALGAYELEGDKLKFCCVVGTWKEKQWMGKPRPTEFKLPAADVVLELRRTTTGE
ncbi:MAG: TIGR03067 domain-containing protein [Phycisphaera sp. RhM]|nr:TIGR03067 domain-containing protein [Phycisphaera sp. RhM]